MTQNMIRIGLFESINDGQIFQNEELGGSIRDKLKPLVTLRQ